MWDRLHRDYFQRRGPRRAGWAAKLVHMAAVVLCGNAGERWKRDGRAGFVPRAEFDAFEVLALWGAPDALRGHIDAGLEACVREGLLVAEGDAGWWIADYIEWRGDPTATRRKRDARKRAKASGTRHAGHSDTRDTQPEDGSEAQDDAHDAEPAQARETDGHGCHGDARDTSHATAQETAPEPRVTDVTRVTDVPVTSRRSRQKRGEENTPDPEGSGVCSPPSPNLSAPQTATANGTATAAAVGGGKPRAERPGVASPGTWSPDRALDDQVQATLQHVRKYRPNAEAEEVATILRGLRRVIAPGALPDDLHERAVACWRTSASARDTWWYSHSEALARLPLPVPEQRLAEYRGWVQIFERIECRAKLEAELCKIADTLIGDVQRCARALVQRGDRDDAWVTTAREVVAKARAPADEPAAAGASA